MNRLRGLDMDLGSAGGRGRNPLDDMPVGRSNSRPNPYDDAPVGQAKPPPYNGTHAGVSGVSRNNLDDFPVGRAKPSTRSGPYDDVPVGRASKNNLDDVPVGRTKPSPRQSPYDDVPVGRASKNNLDDVPVGRTKPSPRQSPYDDVPVGRASKNNMDDVPVGRFSAQSRQNQFDDAPITRSGSSLKNKLGDVDKGADYSRMGKGSPYDEVPVGRKSPASKDSASGKGRDKTPTSIVDPKGGKKASDVGGRSVKFSSHDDAPVSHKGDALGRIALKSSLYDDDIPTSRKTKAAQDDHLRGKSGQGSRDDDTGRKTVLENRGKLAGEKDYNKSSSSRMSSFDDFDKPLSRIGAQTANYDRRSGDLPKSKGSLRDEPSLQRRNNFDDDMDSFARRSESKYDGIPRQRDLIDDYDSSRRKIDLEGTEFTRGKGMGSRGLSGSTSTSFDRHSNELPSHRRREKDDPAISQPSADQKRRLIKPRQPLPANLSGTRYDAVFYATKRLGFLSTADDDFRTPFLIWIDSFISTERLSELLPHQRVNHFPGMAEVCRKDLLAKNLAKAAKAKPREFNFAPRTWCLPAELAIFQQHCKEMQKAEKKRSFISKPVDGAMGHGISLYKFAEDVPESFASECVLQEYVSNPFLIDGLKFDLRLFVLVTSCDPLRVYFYNDGLLRMSSEPYVEPLKTKSDSLLMHITNAQPGTQDRDHRDRQADDDRRATRRSRTSTTDGIRPLRFLNEYLLKRDYDVAQMWRDILELILKTIFLAYPHILKSYRRCRSGDLPGGTSVCFELLGFDVLLDAKLRPWLMEVNRSPSLDVDHPIEREVKLGLLEETLGLLNIRSSDLKQKPDVIHSVSKDKKGLDSLLARMRRQQACAEVDSRVCQRFRRIFPTDDAERQAKLVALMLAVFPVVLETGATSLAKELEAFYANKLSQEEIRKRLITEGVKSGDTAAPDTNDHSDSDDSEDSKSDQRAKKKKRESKAAETVADATTKLASFGPARPTTQHEERTRLALKCLNELRIRLPGKSDQEAERLLTRLCGPDWSFSKPLIGSYWRLSLDAGKRTKVLDIARRSVQVALEKAFRTPSDSAVIAIEVAEADAGSRTSRLPRLLGRVFNRLLWCNGQGLWETFNGKASWEAALAHQSMTQQHELTEAELLCCRRAVQLCQDCLLVVYLYSQQGSAANL